MLVLAIAFAAGLGGALGCGGSVIVWDGTLPLLGVFNGRSIALTLDARGGAVEYDCAHGGLLAPLIPDATGRFEVPGVHVLEHGGPIREGEVPDSLPARFEGVTRGDDLTLRVIVGVDTLGPFTLRRNGEIRLFKCL